MPIITKPSKQMGNIVVTEFVDSVGAQEVTYTFQDTNPQESLSLYNNGANEILVSVGNLSNVSVPAYQGVTLKETFTSFNIKSSSGYGSFKVTASYEIQDEEDERILGEKVNTLNVKLADIAINAKNYGIKGDGVTDDTLAIQNTVNAAAGRVAYIPPASVSYLITGTIEVPDNTTVIFSREYGKLIIGAAHNLTAYEDFVDTTHGMGIEAVITNANHTNGVNVHIIGAYIDGADKLANDQPIAAVMLKNCSHSSVEKCYIKNLPRHPNSYSEDRRRHFDILQWGGEDNTIAHNECYAVGYECIGIRYGAKNSRVLNNYCEQGLGGHTIQLTASWANFAQWMVEGIIVNGNVCINGGHSGIALHHASRCVISENVIRNASYSGIGVMGPEAQYNTVSDNIIINTDKHISPTTHIGVGIHVAEYAFYNVFTGNVIEGSVGNGILVDGSTGDSANNTVANNIIRSSTGEGIKVNLSNQCQVIGNQILNSMAAGIYIITSNYSQIENNNIQSNEGSGLLLSGGSGNLLIGNIVRFNKQYGIYLFNNTAHNTVSNNRVDTNGRATNATYDNIILGSNASYNNVQGNIVRQGSETNKPKYGINVSSSNASQNFISNNDLLTSGTTGAFNDLGTGTVNVNNRTV